jgi:hypothetical protein
VDDDAASPSESTPSVPPREFAADALHLLADAFRGFVRACEDGASVVAAGRGDPATLDEFAERLDDIANMSAGSARGLRRMIKAERPNQGGL